MASDNNYGNNRTAKNYRSCPGDRRKMKSDVNFKGRPLQTENVNRETKQCGGTDVVPCNPEKVVYSGSYNSSRNILHQERAGNYRNSFQYKNNQCSGRPSEPNFVRGQHVSFKCRKTLDYGKAKDVKWPDLEHSKPIVQPRHPETVDTFRQNEDASCCSINLLRQMGNPEETVDTPIKPPHPRCPDLPVPQENMSHGQEQYSVRDVSLPHRTFLNETYEMYLNRPDHKIGTGLYLAEIEDLPPRHGIRLRRGFEEIEIREKELEYREQQYREKMGIFQPTAAAKNTCVTPVRDKFGSHQQNRGNQRIQQCQQNKQPGERRNTQNAPYGSAHPRGKWNENHFRHSNGTKGAGIKKYEDRTLLHYEHQKQRGPAHRNTPKYNSNNYDDRRSFRTDSSCGKQTPLPAFKNCDQQLSSSFTTFNKDHQDNGVKQTSANFVQHNDCRSDGFAEALQQQAKGDGEKKTSDERSIETFQKENKEHHNFETTKKDAPSVSVQSELRLQQKMMQDNSLNPQDSCSLQLNSCALSRGGSIEHGGDPSSGVSGTKVNGPDSQNSSVIKHRDHLPFSDGGHLASDKKDTQRKDAGRKSECNEEKRWDFIASCETQAKNSQLGMRDRQHSCDSSVSYYRGRQNNKVKQTECRTDSHTDGHSVFSPSQKKPRSRERINSEGDFRKFPERNPENLDSKTSTDDRTRKEGSRLGSMQSDRGNHKNSQDSQDRGSSQFNKCRSSERSLMEQGSASSFERSDPTEVNVCNSLNSPAKKYSERSSLSSDGQVSPEKKFESPSFIGSGQLSTSGSRSVSSKKDWKNLVKVKVSGAVRNLDYWRHFLETALPHLKFEIGVDDAITQMLRITFCDENDAMEAKMNLRNVKRNYACPYIKVVKSPTYFKSPSNGSLKILDGCLRDIDKLYGRVISSHEKIIATTKRELESAKERGDQGSVLAIQERLKEYEEMQDVFFRYTEDKKKEMNAEVEKPNTSFDSISRNLLQMKKDFIREFNCLKGCLPIYARKEVILDVIRKNQVSVIVAETGSGKSTQLVQYLLQSHLNKDGIIVCTQPRKIAAVSIAKYISGQLGSPVGATVGYEVGLDKKITHSTKIVYMTDYVLLKKCVNNRNLDGISCVVVDEAHERSLFTDLLLAIIKKCLTNRSDIHVIITSATIDPGVFQDYFNLSSKAVLSVPGRTYPVQVKWQGTDAHVGWNYLEGCVKRACEIHEEYDSGDILVFLTSPQETDDAVSLFKQTLSTRKDKPFPVLFSLHGKQDMEEQMKIFSPTTKGCRKIIFATNAAETSVTIPGIKFVIDSGMVKEKQYIADKNRNALVVGFISKSSAEQRKGRAGRTQPGICYRMYSEQNYAKDMRERVTPEILRINLQLALLRIMEFKMQPEDFDFVETPPKESISSALHSLEFLGAVKDKCFTDLGKQIIKLPLEPQLGKLVILGAEENVGFEACAIASIATVSGMVFYRNEDNRVTADKKKMKFCKEEGDFITFLNVFKQWYRTPPELKSQWAAENCINAKALRIASQTTEELIQTLRYELKIKIYRHFKPSDVFVSKSERILFECFSENVCVFSGHRKTGYLSPFEPGSFFLHPSSSLCYLDNKFHSFVVFSSVLKTSRTFLLNITPIQESTIISAYQKGVFPYQIDMLKLLQILPARIYPVGESILIREVLGRQGYKLHEIEQQIKAFTKTEDFHIEVNVEKGEILIYIEQQFHATVSKLVNTIIQEAQCHMAKEEEMFRIADCASSCFAVTSGGAINDILLPGEFREVIVEGFTKNTSVDRIASELKNFGALQSFQEAEERGNHQILATYVKAADAQKAVEHLQKSKLFDIAGKVSYAKLSDKSLPLFRLQVTWPRFPCLGTGWISFRTVTDCIEASGILTNKSFYIDDRYILFAPAQSSEKELSMKNLPSYVEPQDVMRSLKSHLPNYLEVKNVNLVRAKSYRVTETEMSSIKKQLSQMFSQYTPSSKLVIDLKSPNAYESLWTALVYFENFEDGENAVVGLKDKAKIGEHKLHIRPLLKSSIQCHLQVFKMVEKNLHVLVAYSKKGGICTEFDIKPATTKNKVLITFSCNDIRNLNKVRQEIQKLVRGTTMICTDEAMYSRLFSRSGEEYLKGIQQNTQTMISTNTMRKTVTIFGPEKAISSAKSLISCYVSTSNDEQMRVFNLAGKKIPSGFLRTLRQKFGFGLRGLIEKFSLRAADVDFGNRKLIVKCSGKTMQMVEQCLAELCQEVQKSNAQNQSSNQESCPVCLDTITSDLYRLNHCGHPFCRQCLLLQMESQVIPLVCAKEGCEKPIFVEDINKLLSNNDELRKEFSQAALKNFISRSGSVRYCPVPDCSMVYRVTSHGAEFHCPSCENDICTKCHAFYHHGMTCDMFQKSKVDEDYPLKVWMQEDSENRKLCPKCSSGIEKIGGCNHVLCAHCDTHLCWVCLRTFSCSEDVYDHLPFCDYS